jgi:serine/threonine-protein kinase Chk1
MRVHSALKHQHVLEFLNAVVVEMKHKMVYIPGIYMLVEYAGGGDLFDKIGGFFSNRGSKITMTLNSS